LKWFGTISELPINVRKGFAPDVSWEARPPNVRNDGTAASLKEARAEFQEVLDGWKAWAKLEEMP
jgi:hypothetical protein